MMIDTNASDLVMEFNTNEAEANEKYCVISRLDKLAKLVHFNTLNLAENKIESIEGIENLR